MYIAKHIGQKSLHRNTTLSLFVLNIGHNGVLRVRLKLPYPLENVSILQSNTVIEQSSSMVV